MARIKSKTQKKVKTVTRELKSGKAKSGKGKKKSARRTGGKVAPKKKRKTK